MRGDRERCLAAGMDSYITKPISRTELFSAIDSVLQSCQPAAASLLPLQSGKIPVACFRPALPVNVSHIPRRE